MSQNSRQRHQKAVRPKNELSMLSDSGKGSLRCIIGFGHVSFVLKQRKDVLCNEYSLYKSVRSLVFIYASKRTQNDFLSGCALNEKVKGLCVKVGEPL